MVILMCIRSMDLLMWLFRPFTNFTSDHISEVLSDLWIFTTLRGSVLISV